MKSRITIALLSLLALGSTNTIHAQEHDKVQITTQVKEGKVESNLVCYVNDKYMGKEQIPVEVDGKTYYGCCKGCVINLQNNREVRYAIDPLTNKEVDKATAYIVIKSGTDGEVQYFESEQNYQKYVNTKK